MDFFRNMLSLFIYPVWKFWGILPKPKIVSVISFRHCLPLHFLFISIIFSSLDLLFSCLSSSLSLLIFFILSLLFHPFLPPVLSRLVFVSIVLCCLHWIFVFFSFVLFCFVFHLPSSSLSFLSAFFLCLLCPSLCVTLCDVSSCCVSRWGRGRGCGRAVGSHVCLVCVCLVCGVLRHAEKPGKPRTWIPKRLRVLIQNVPVGTGTTCRCSNTSARPGGTHAYVLNVHMEPCRNAHTAGVSPDLLSKKSSRRVLT